MGLCMNKLSSVFLIAMIVGVLAAGAGIASPGGPSGNHGVINTKDAQRESKKTARSIKWETSLDRAKEAAQKYNKPIFWVHMLGNIDGFT